MVLNCTHSDSSRVILVTFLVDSFLVIINLFPTGVEFIDVFLDLDGESTLSTWYSSAKLLVVALAAWSVARDFKRTRWPFGGLALFTLALSASETAMIHERLSGVLHWVFSGERLEDGGHGIWVLYFLPVVIAVIAWLLWTIRVAGGRSGPATRWIVACLALWSGVIMLELVPRSFAVHSEPAIRVLSVFEEGFELWGASCLLAGLCLLSSTIKLGSEQALQA